jgi:hypothetical protein
LERYELGVAPEVSVRVWPQIQADIDQMWRLHYHIVDYAAIGELAVALIGELHGAYVRLPQQRREVLIGVISAHRAAMRTAKDLGGYGLPGLAARAVQRYGRSTGRRGVAGVRRGRAGVRHW